MKKLILAILTFSFILTGCTSNKLNNDAGKIAKALKEEFQLTEKDDEGNKVVVEAIDIEVLNSYYISAYSSVLEVDKSEDKVSDQQKDYLEALEAFFYLFLSQAEEEEETVVATHLGYNGTRGYSGMFIVEFDKDVIITDEIVEAVNRDFNNQLEYIYTYKNILVIVDHGFFEDMGAAMTRIDTVVKSIVSDEK